MSFDRALLPHPETPTWKALRQALAERLAELSTEIEQDLDPIHTAKIRGRISELRQLMRAVNDAAGEDETEPHASVPFV